MKIGLTSTRIGNPSTRLDDLLEEIRRAEADGFHSFSLPHIFGFDALTTLALAGRETSRIQLATGVVPTPPRHPVAMAQQALTTQAACAGRFHLGIGLSHKLVIEDLFGLSYARPAAQMREYLEVLVPLVQGKPASFEGQIYRTQAQLQVAGADPVPVLVAALGPLMLEVAGELAEGTATWMTGPKTLEEHTLPTIRAAARAAGRPAPRVVAALPLALTEDLDTAREAAARSFAVYGALPSYRAMLDREGVEGPGDVALVGDEATLRAGLQRLRDIGVDELAASLYPAGDGVLERTRKWLQGQL